MRTMEAKTRQTAPHPSGFRVRPTVDVPGYRRCFRLAFRAAAVAAFEKVLTACFWATHKKLQALGRRLAQKMGDKARALIRDASAARDDPRRARSLARSALSLSPPGSQLERRARAILDASQRR